MKKFQKFLKEYDNSILSSTPLKRTENQAPYFDAEMKNKTFFNRGKSYDVPMFKISLKIPGGYVTEVRGLPMFRKIDEEIEKLKQRARENNVQIQVDKSGGIEFYRKLHYKDVLERISPEEAFMLNEMLVQKRYIQNQILSDRLHPQVRKFLQSEFYEKFKRVQRILEKIVKDKKSPEPVKPSLRIVK